METTGAAYPVGGEAYALQDAFATKCGQPEISKAQPAQLQAALLQIAVSCRPFPYGPFVQPTARLSKHTARTRSKSHSERYS